MFSGIRAVLFDAVGTLIYPDPAVDAVYYRAGHRHGSQLTRDQIRDRLRQAFVNYFGGHFSNQAHELEINDATERLRWQALVAAVFVDLEDTSLLFHELWEHFASPQSWSLFDDVNAAWTALASRGLTLAVASNFDGRLLKIAGQIPPLDRAHEVFVSSALGAAKPREQFYREIEQRLGLDPQQLLLVGDSKTNDFMGARGAGWNALLLTREPEDEFSEIGSIVSLSEIPQWLS